MEEIVSTDPLMYIETALVVMLAVGVRRVASKLAVSTVAQGDTLPCGVYAALCLVGGMFFSLVVAAVDGSFGALVNMLTNVPLVIASVVVILRTAERVAVDRALSVLAKGIVTLRGLLALVIAPWLLYVLDHPLITPDISIEQTINELPEPVGALVFVVMPLLVQIFAYRGTEARFMFARGFLATIALMSFLLSVTSALDLDYQIGSGIVAVVGAGVTVRSPVTQWDEGFEVAGSTVSVGALLSSLASPLFPLEVRTVLQYAMLCTACALLNLARSGTRDDQVVIGAAAFQSVALSTRVIAGIATEVMGEVNVVGFAVSGVVGLGALYASYVALAPAPSN